MLVSTRAATSIEILPPPAPLRHPAHGGSARIPNPLSLRGLIEQAEPLFETKAWRWRTWGNDSDDLSRRLPVDLVSRRDTIAFRHHFGDRDLELARDLRHVLTITRMASLVKSFGIAPWTKAPRRRALIGGSLHRPNGRGRRPTPWGKRTPPLCGLKGHENPAWQIGGMSWPNGLATLQAAQGCPLSTQGVGLRPWPWAPFSRPVGPDGPAKASHQFDCAVAIWEIASGYMSQYLFGAGGRVVKGSTPSISLARIRPISRRLNW